MDPSNMPTRPPPAIYFFMLECREAYLKAHPNPNDRSGADLRKLVQKGWSEMSEADQAIYLIREAHLVEEYNRKLAAYNKEAQVANLHVQRPPSALVLFMKESREAHPNDDGSGADFRRHVGERWAQMPEAEKATYYAREKQLQKEYNTKLAAAHNKEATQKKKKEVAAMDGNMRVRRPPSAIVLFMKESREAYKKAHPNDGSKADFRRHVEQTWKQMSEADKAPYYARAKQLLEDYNEKLAEESMQNQVNHDDQNK